MKDELFTRFRSNEEPARIQILVARQPRGQRLWRPQSGLFVRGDGELFLTQGPTIMGEN